MKRIRKMAHKAAHRTAMSVKAIAVATLLLSLLLALAGCGPRADQPQSDTGTAQSDAAVQTDTGAQSPASAEDFDAKSYVEVLCSGDAASLPELYPHTQELLDGMEDLGGFEGLQKQLMLLGEFSGVEDPEVSQISGYTAYSVPCEFSLQNINIIVNVDSQGQVAGIFTTEYSQTSRTEGETEASLPSGLSEVELTVPVAGHEGWALGGTLTLPSGDGPFPAVILIHGSGPNDRDETIGPNKPFRDLAWDLAQQGIAVFRYDKRTYVYSDEMAQMTDLTLDGETVEDGASAFYMLREQEKIDPEKIFILGHSLGGEALPRLHMMLKQENAAPAGYIFMAAPARPMAQILREQCDFLYSLDQGSDEAMAAQKEEMYNALDQLDNIENLADDEILLGAYGTYWKDLAAYDPVETAAAMDVSCLVLQGEEDYQVTMEDFSIWQDTFGNDPNWTFKSYPGLTHLFMEGKKANGPADYMTLKHVDPQVTEDIADFIQ